MLSPDMSVQGNFQAMELEGETPCRYKGVVSEGAGTLAFLP